MKHRSAAPAVVPPPALVVVALPAPREAGASGVACRAEALAAALITAERNSAGQAHISYAAVLDRMNESHPETGRTR